MRLPSLLLSLLVGAITAFAVPTAAAADIKTFKLSDGGSIDLGALPADGLVSVQNAGKSPMQVRIWNAGTGNWEQYNVPPGQRWRNWYPQFSQVQIADVADHVDGKGAYSLPKP